MSKLNIGTTAGGYRSVQSLNEDFSAIRDAIENTLSRDGMSPNQMEADLDMNNNKILNLPVPVDPTDPIRLVDFEPYNDALAELREATESAQQLGNSVVRTSDHPDPINSKRVWFSDTGWNPETDPIPGQSTPETALISLGGQYNLAGGAGDYYRWGIQCYMTNPNTAPITGINTKTSGYKVRGLGASVRQYGNGGDAHACELLIGQGLNTATATANNTAILTNIAITTDGAKFDEGNTVSIYDSSSLTSGTLLGTATIVSMDDPFAPTTMTLSGPLAASGTVYLRSFSADSQNIGLLISGLGASTSEGGKGNPDGRAIQIQSYDNSAFKYGLVFGTSSLRTDGTGIRFASSPGTRALSLESTTMTDSAIYMTSNANLANGMYMTGNTMSGSGIRFASNTADYGIRISADNTFAFAAIFLEGQNIGTDSTTGMKIATNSTSKLGLWGRTPIARPAAMTQTYTTADRTLSAYTSDPESTPYTGATAPDAAKLTDINALRVAYENLRVFTEDLAQFVNSHIDDEQAWGFYA